MSVDEFGRMFNARLNLLWWGCKAAICLSFRPLGPFAQQFHPLAAPDELTAIFKRVILRAAFKKGCLCK